jgi:hypothetical protein
MCKAITLIIASDNQKRLTEILDALDTGNSRCQAYKVTHPALSGVLHPYEHEFSVGTSMCACDSIVGGGLSVSEGGRDPVRERYLKKGWSEAKIAGAFADMRRAGRLKYRGQFYDSTGYWINLLHEVCVGLSLRQVALMQHFYSKHPERESFNPLRVSGGPIADGARAITTMGDGVVVDFTLR